jgi:ubiquinone/menaquinone biosynthesis C-methylase UbiE
LPLYNGIVEDKMVYFYEVYGTLPRAGPGDDASTSKAYQMMTGLPEKLKILDIGCGPGKQTLELARLSKGKIIALDNHQPFLDKINEEARALGLSGYIETLNRDMNAMDFDAESFDIIWAEGALYLMGFENGLRVCRPLLKRNGYIGVTELVWLVDHPSPEAKAWAKEYEAMKNVPENLLFFKNTGYEMVGHFTLPVSSWFREYYEGRVPAAMQVIDSAQQEIDGFKRCSKEAGYEFFVARVTISG